MTKTLNADAVIERALNGENILDLVQGQPLAELAALMKRAQAVLDRATEAKTAAQKVYDLLRLNAIPDAMEEASINSANIEGVGRVTLTSDAYVTLPAAYRLDMRQWCVNNGFEDLITETINGSTLKAWVTRRMREGQEIPEYIKVTPFTRASITTVS